MSGRIMENEEIIENEIKELEVLNQMSQVTTQEVDNAKIDSPVKFVEKSLSQFVADAFEVTRRDFELSDAIQQSLIQDLATGALTANQKIALLGTHSVNLNDRISKMVSPTLQLMTARQQAEIAAASQIATQKQAQNSITNITNLNQDAPKDVIQGMTLLNNLLTTIMKEKKEEEKETKENK
jgi:hypothetical protein